MKKPLKIFLIVFSSITAFLLIALFCGFFILSNIATNQIKSQLSTDGKMKFKNILIMPIPLSCSISDAEIDSGDLKIKADKIKVTTSYLSVYNIMKANTLQNVGIEINNLSISNSSQVSSSNPYEYKVIRTNALYVGMQNNNSSLGTGNDVKLLMKYAYIKYKGTFSIDSIKNFDFLTLLKEKQNVYFELIDLSMQNIDKLFENSDLDQKTIGEYIGLIKLFTTIKHIKINVAYDNKLPAIIINNFVMISNNLNGSGKCKAVLYEKTNSIKDIDGKLKLNFKSDSLINFPMPEDQISFGFRNFNFEIQSGDKSKKKDNLDKNMMSLELNDFYFNFKNKQNFGLFLIDDDLINSGKYKAENFLIKMFFKENILSAVFDWKSSDFFNIHYETESGFENSNDIERIRYSHFTEKSKFIRHRIIERLKDEYNILIDGNEDINLLIEKQKAGGFKVTKI